MTPPLPCRCCCYCNIRYSCYSCYSCHSCHPLLHPLPQEYTERQRFKFKLSHWQCRDLIETLCRYDAKQRAKRYRRSPTAEGSSVSPHLARLTAIAAHILCSCPGVPRLTRRNARALAGCATSSFSAETFLGRGRHMLA